MHFRTFCCGSHSKMPWIEFGKMRKGGTQNVKTLSSSLPFGFPMLYLVIALGTSTAVLMLANFLTLHFSTLHLSKSLNQLSTSLREELGSHAASYLQDALEVAYEGASAHSKLLTPVRSAARVGFQDFEAMVRPPTFAAFSFLTQATTLEVRRLVDNTFLGYTRSSACHSARDRYFFCNSSSAAQPNVTLYTAAFDPVSGAPDGSRVNHAEAPNAHLSENGSRAVSWHVSASTACSCPCLRLSRPAPEAPSKWGFVASAICLKRVANALRNLAARTNGAVLFITSQEGHLLAASDTSPLISENPLCQHGGHDAMCLVLATQSQSHVIREVAHKFPASLTQGLRGGEPVFSSDAQIDGKWCYVDIRHMQYRNFSYAVSVVVPKASIMGEMSYHNLQMMPMVFVTALILSTLGFLLTNILIQKFYSNFQWWKQAPALRRGELPSEHKSRFMANMSHELRTPMACIIGLMEILQSDESLSMDHREIVSQIRRCSKALLGILNNILDLSRIDAGKLDLEVSPFDITNELESLVEMFSVQCATSGVSIGLDLADDIPSMVKSDPCRFRQIFANLLSNSVKFTPRGWICVRGRVIERRVSSNFDEGNKVGANSMEIVIRFEVEDSGIGIPHEKWNTVFESFVQADESSTREHGGSGLGLSIVQALVEKMGGRVSIQPKSGSGTLVRLDLAFRPVLSTENRSAFNPSAEEHLLIECERKSERGRKKVDGGDAELKKRIGSPFAGKPFSTSAPDVFKSVRVLICIKENVEVGIAQDWLKRKGVSAIGTTDWNFALKSIRVWATKLGNLSESFRNSSHNECGGSELNQEKFLVLMDLSLVPGFVGLSSTSTESDLPSDRLAELKSLLRPGMVLAWLMPPTSPPNLRKFLRESTSSLIANKPLYPNKMWRLLQCMIGLRIESSSELDRNSRSPFTNSLGQDMLVAQGTDVHLTSLFRSAILPRPNSRAKLCMTPPSRASERGSATRKANKDYWDEYLENCSGEGGTGSLKIEGIESLMRAIEKEMQDTDPNENEEEEEEEEEEQQQLLQQQQKMDDDDGFYIEGSGKSSSFTPEDVVEPNQSMKLRLPEPRSSSFPPRPVPHHSVQLISGRVENDTKRIEEDLRQKILTKSIEIKRKNLKPLLTSHSFSPSTPSSNITLAEALASINALSSTVSASSSLTTLTSSTPISISIFASSSSSSTTSTSDSTPPDPPASDTLPMPILTSSFIPTFDSSFSSASTSIPSSTSTCNSSLSNSSLIAESNQLPDQLNGECPADARLHPSRSDISLSCSSEKKSTDWDQTNINQDAHSMRPETNSLIISSNTPKLLIKPLFRSQSHPRMHVENPFVSAPSVVVPDTIPRSLPDSSFLTSSWNPSHQTLEPSLKDMNILVVEDTNLLRKIIITTLEKMGATVSSARDGAEAVEAIIESQGYKKVGYDFLSTNPFENMDWTKYYSEAENSEAKFPFHAVIMDCQMPRLDGYSATEHIREFESIVGGHVPIIALTAHGMASDRIKCLNAGMDEYLSKPANGKKIAEIVKKLVRKKKG